MATIKAVDFERSRVGRGIKTVALVLVLTAAALTADHLFFPTPSARLEAAPITFKTTTTPNVVSDGFALPEHLRPTAADVGAAASTF